MASVFTCGRCGKKMKADEHQIGLKVSCPGCGHEQVAPPIDKQQQILDRLDQLGGIAISINRRLGWILALMFIPVVYYLAGLLMAIGFRR